MIYTLLFLIVSANSYTLTFVQNCPTAIPGMRLASGDSDHYAELLKNLPQNGTFTLTEDVDDFAYFCGEYRRLGVDFRFLEGEDRRFDEVEYGIRIMSDSMETMPIKISPNDASLPSIACDNMLRRRSG
ncbi:hypothetical protein PMAYCL1PPCAC_08075 [Pristionchus mayeri]|uniref:Uncharacterized protein n=1 Tax=Pristionchus mayeri TaxID=1317129 RepID=A0AAN5CBC1_9BILA|nr:hypothetical protein PMAYCL1PPCAC_08075 [Pristionchus mayeri]